VKPPPALFKFPVLALIITMGAIAAGIVAALFFRVGKSELGPSISHPAYVARPRGTVTFNKDIAPILYSQCAACHRPGESAPFNLITVDDARKRARQIVKVTEDRFMPPFLPEPGLLRLSNERRLTADQIGVIRQWAEEGAVEGAAADLPSPPHWAEGWQLGPPDLVVTMPESYLLGADGPDVYRNFVVPVTLAERRFIRAVEFRPGTRGLHHVFIQVDRTRTSRQMDEQDAGPGFNGMDNPITAESPSGHFLGWQPGRGPTEMPQGLPWVLDPGTDLVLQIHMQPSGKPEEVQPSIGLYFTSGAPTNTPFKLALSSYAIDIPPGATDYIVEDHFDLPVDVQLLAVLPHAHFLGKRLEGFATFPDGARLLLLRIDRWDFNWQSDYRYANPVVLPRGTRLSMRYSYDNSEGNPRNPNQPPIRVQYGLQSTDEMGEFWLQLITRTPADLDRLRASYALRVAEDSIQFSQLVLKKDPTNARAHNNLGKAMIALGRPQDGLQHFQIAARLKPDFDEARYHLGVMANMAGKTVEAEQEFVAAIKANPSHFKARNNLGLIYLEQRRFAAAKEQFKLVLQLNAEDSLARNNLELLRRTLDNSNP
jgi:hypothetical protein